VERFLALQKKCTARKELVTLGLVLRGVVFVVAVVIYSPNVPVISVGECREKLFSQQLGWHWQHA
jgi:hypothetical protein